MVNHRVDANGTVGALKHYTQKLSDSKGFADLVQFLKFNLANFIQAVFISTLTEYQLTDTNTVTNKNLVDAARNCSLCKSSQVVGL